MKWIAGQHVKHRRLSPPGRAGLAHDRHMAGPTRDVRPRPPARHRWPAVKLQQVDPMDRNSCF